MGSWSWLASPALGIVRTLVRGERVRYYGESNYNRIFVFDRGSLRYLVFAGESQGRWDIRPELTYQTCIGLGSKGPGHTPGDYFQLFRLFMDAPCQALLIGLGGGAIAKKLLADYSGLQLTSVELDPLVVVVAEGWFDLPRTPRHLVVVGDGRQFLDHNPARYDLLMIDAFSDRAMPGKLLTEEFFVLTAKRLKPGGIMAVNINGALQGRQSHLFRAAIASLSRAYKTWYVFPRQPRYPKRIQSILVFACQDRSLTGAEIFKRARGELGSMAASLWKNGIDLASPLTDHQISGNGMLDIYTYREDGNGRSL